MTRTTSRAIAVGVALFVALILVSPALAYNETTSTISADWACGVCHDNAADESEVTSSTGPHGGYTTSSNKCQACHAVHESPGGGVKLLPGATITATCFTCHDGTGGKGVYGTIASPGSEHSVDATSLVPGGDASTGTSASYTFSNEDGTMNCADCHSPHAKSVVNAFVGDRVRTDQASKSGYESNRLLKSRPNGITYDIVEYGSDWCGACHKGRLIEGDGVINHPVETTATVGYFYYDNVARLTGDGTTDTVMGTLGQSNYGYVIPYPRGALQTVPDSDTVHYPLCQQCHEDARSVGDVVIGQAAAAETFTAVLDGAGAGNPDYQDFPHESENEWFLVETADDLCTNCHSVEQLP